MKLKINYKSDNKIEKSLDGSLITTLEKLGFEEIGSGYNFQTGERDISFESLIVKGN